MIPSRNSRLILLVAPPGAGKSTLAKKYESEGFIRISQDSQGKFGHQELFRNSIINSENIIVDRMGFDKKQRRDYLIEAKKAGYETEIIVLHEPYQVCLERMFKRTDHPTIKDEKSARSALQTFFTRYERPTSEEADKIEFRYPEGDKSKAIICDLDGTLCDVAHRRYHVRRTDGQKKDWKAFFDGIPNDPINEWCHDILKNFAHSHKIVLCTGRDENHKQNTIDWLKRHDVYYDALHMRNRNDSRQDSIIKEIIYCFEIKTRYDILFAIDDRPSVCRMWKSHGLTVLQCNDEEF